MSVVNSSVDHVMRQFVTRRMRSQIGYDRSDTAIVVVASSSRVGIEDVPNGDRLLRWARATGIAVVIAPKIRGGDDSPDRGDSVFAADGVRLDPFLGLSAFTNPALRTTLADMGLDRVIIVGSRTEIEIDSTARDAIESGLHTTVISDCCKGVTPPGHDATMSVTLPRLIHAVVTLDQLPELTR